MAQTVLAIDTATEVAGVALYDPATGPRAESTWHTSMNHTVELMPTVVQMLERQGIAAERLDALAVALGPGSFTGLRIGLSVAKGLSFSLGIPIVGIPTLDVVAYAHYEQDFPICAIIQAGRGRICAASYEKRGGKWQQTTDYRLVAVQELASRIDSQTLFCGEIDTSVRRELEEKLGSLVTIASPASSLRRAGYLAELGWRQLRARGGDDVASLEPLYLHHPGDGD
ncbi:MAG: tRNA (adenosine(37)-N6)-threonylcarbamoyltransferase complex dimerization subunit type 1 TsaB [Chloroflexi bacterium B3_Chlor]|nr:MAG: tRNA (adenosine(37)-N6)-threonylcarbamoyltransferase complex dimerization subunit type 1 TsaB [Chloroflexi bacterium B3_Chlor]